MDGGRIVGPAVVLVGMACGILGRAAGGEPGSDGEALAVRLIHPDRQAAEILHLFDGARWRDPAAALAAWKHRHPDSGLGKPAEAVIALFNPEMADECRALDDAEIRVEIDRATGAAGWFVVVPHDDGTVAAGITAMRLTNPDDRPLTVDGRAIPVARVGRSGVPLACQVGGAVVVADSRERLERGVAMARAGRRPIRDGSGGEVDGDGPPVGVESGTVFRLEPGLLPTPRGGSLTTRRLIEALHAIECRRILGVASLKDGTLAVDLSTTFAPEAATPRPATADPAWWEALPTDRVMAMASIAIDPSSWDRAFAAADRAERVDPARARMAPLRTRLNLLALGAGIPFEADVRPHLRGVSGCLFGDPGRPGRVAGVLILLHLDDPAVAARLVRQATPRLGGLIGDDASRALTLRASGRDIRLSWGEQGRPAPGRSLAALCGGRADRAQEPPARVGAFWPARIWRPSGLDQAAADALAEDPPVLWRGWSEPGREHDVLRWDGLDGRVRSFLAAIPLEPGARVTLPAARVSGPDSKIQN